MYGKILGFRNTASFFLKYVIQLNSEIAALVEWEQVDMPIQVASTSPAASTFGEAPGRWAEAHRSRPPTSRHVGVQSYPDVPHTPWLHAVR